MSTAARPSCSIARRSIRRPAASRSTPAAGRRRVVGGDRSRGRPHRARGRRRRSRRRRGAAGTIDWAAPVRSHAAAHRPARAVGRVRSRAPGARPRASISGPTRPRSTLRGDVSAEAIAAAEHEANRIVWEDRPVRVRFVSEEEAASLPLRKEPARGGTLRLVEVAGFDLSACGGTHVARTGAIGMIAVIGLRALQGRHARGVRLRRTGARAFP